MSKGRLEAFSDGVIVIIITIMVLELKVPHGADLAALRPLLPVFLGYVLSFTFVGIYWNNHYLLAIALAFEKAWISCALYVLVAVLWLIPDRRIEKTLAQIT